MSRYQFPPLEDEKEFEDLINDLCMAKYEISFQVYGRKGQGQDGIDGLSFSRDKKQIVFQCKNKLIHRNDKKIQTELLKDIEDEVKTASTEFTDINTFIFANSFKQDTALQNKAIELTKQYGFTVIVWSWEEIEKLLEAHKNIAKHYYPYFFDKSILTEQDIKQKLKENSLLLLSSSNLYIEKNFINMPEFDKALEFINKKDSDDNLLVITGKAGIGKTALLSKIQSNLIENDIAYLSIKSDKFDIEKKDSISKFFGVENILHSIKQLARKEKVVVLIDQLDALSLTMSSNQKTIHIILEFIEQLKYISNLKIIVSIREYDLKNDPLFKNLDNSNIINTQLLNLGYVNTKLKSYIKESTKLNNTLIELLRTPLHLILFIELYPNDNSCISIKTLQDLYNKFWEQKIKLINKDIRKNIIELLSSIVQKMNEIKKIEVPILYFEDEVEELNLLFSNGILKQENNKISFFHQTFYEYVFAKDFMKKNISLFEYILTTSQDLNIREQFKQIIQFLRGTDEDKYLLELENILYSDKIRFHIKLLLISYLGSLENPTNEEFIFIQKLFRDMENFERYFIESLISSDWLIYLKNANFFSSENFKKYNLHYKLETFVNKEPNLVLEILDNCECDTEIKDEAIMLSLERLDKWDEYSFGLFSKYHYLLFKDNTRFILEKIYKKVYAFNQEYAINLFFDFLNINIEKIDNTDRKKLLNHNWYEIFKFLIESNNINIFERLLNSIEKISTKFKNEYSKKEFLITDKIFDSTMWQFDNLHNSTWSLYRKTLEKISQLALDNKDIFLKLIKPYQDTHYLSLITFLIVGYSKNPNEYKNEIFKLFTNLELLEEISFSQDNGYELALILDKSFKLFNDIEQKEIFNTIIKVNPKWQNKWSAGKFNGNY
ncbi:MAG: NACHT domain-containing NTPase, partial [Arcobacter sp.]|uniref:NACHT domain-containing protein n=1 Tax=Arcobacter sp. TaxID=1872629 RepID=UPI003D025478